MLGFDADQLSIAQPINCAAKLHVPGTCVHSHSMTCRWVCLHHRNMNMLYWAAEARTMWRCTACRLRNWRLTSSSPRVPTGTWPYCSLAPCSMQQISSDTVTASTANAGGCTSATTEQHKAATSCEHWRPRTEQHAFPHVHQQLRRVQGDALWAFGAYSSPTT